VIDRVSGIGSGHHRDRQTLSKYDDNGNKVLWVLLVVLLPVIGMVLYFFDRQKELTHHEEVIMTLGTVLLILIVLLLVGAIPTWPHSRSWGYMPSGVFTIILVILIVLYDRTFVKKGKQPWQRKVEGQDDGSQERPPRRPEDAER